ncbi:MAG: SCP2 sterol-binding domain-containing protein, partial [Armatimonadetes bacterium]|nr:SCP2 sterol-binding domain-containing protein [Armatimonadota bacterium]
EGAFRIAIYGQTQSGGGAPQGFVVRSPLLTGVAKEELEATAAHAELTRFCAQAGRTLEISGLAQLDVIVQIDATGPGGGQWWLRLSEGKSVSGEGSVENADLTVTASANDLLSVARGELSPRQAWDRGLVRASGDQDLLGELGTALGF